MLTAHTVNICSLRNLDMLPSKGINVSGLKGYPEQISCKGKGNATYYRDVKQQR